ncbi:MAG: ADP-forming succinate--CoA ligase subunit beta [Alphaproteobacteria bacterium]|nr:ADP-forming succinate--CoA ligase subunit beta [Alphaproteobacteria bacterium]
MNIHEFQAKELLGRFGVPLLKGGVAATAAEAAQVARGLSGPVSVVKAQIHAGGRGAGRFKNDPNGKGGVRIVRSPADVQAQAAAMLGQVLVTKQTGPTGREVRRVYVEEGCEIARELYLSLVIDRAAGCVGIATSAQGGMDIEEVAARDPAALLSIAVDPAQGLMPYHARKLAFFLKLEGEALKRFGAMLDACYRAYTQLDASLLEINPLVVTKAGALVALDAKVTLDDNALFRHKDLAELRDADEEDPMELEAIKNELNYVRLAGNIGCMVNGAGLAMATMDIIKLAGGQPANFLDVGGGASKEKTTAAFKIVLSDPNVKGILVNIFGGINRCDWIAQGVIAAVRGLDLHLPLVVRLEGTNVEEGKRILAESGLAIIPAKDLGDAAQKVVAAVQKVA